jgi:hypothetical protein
MTRCRRRSRAGSVMVETVGILWVLSTAYLDLRGLVRLQGRPCLIEPMDFHERSAVAILLLRFPTLSHSLSHRGWGSTGSSLRSRTMRYGSWPRRWRRGSQPSWHGVRHSGGESDGDRALLHLTGREPAPATWPPAERCPPRNSYARESTLPWPAARLGRRRGDGREGSSEDETYDYAL